LWQLRFGTHPQGVGVSRDGLLDLLGWIGGEGGKYPFRAQDALMAKCKPIHSPEGAEMQH
jgi:hypothetical protein